MKEIEKDIIELIRSGIATNKRSIASTLNHHLDDGQLYIGPVENALERMKRKGLITYNGPAKSWEVVGEARNNLVTTPSQPSAPPIDAVIGSEDKEVNNPPSGSHSTPTKPENIMNTKTNDDSTSKIDAAINAAKSRKAKNKSETTSTESTGEKTSRPRLTAEAKEARDLQRETERAEKKAERDRVRTAKQAAKQAERKPAHMSKVDKAAEKLPGLDNAVGAFFNELTVNFTQVQLSALSAHLQHFNRVKATERALNQKVTMGSTVRITGGDNRFIGMEGTVSKAQRIRCYVSVPGVKKDVYLFTSDCEVLEMAQAATG